MKIPHRLGTCLLAAGLAASWPLSAFAQGTSTPPAANPTISPDKAGALVPSGSISYGNGEAVASVQLYATELSWTGNRSMPVDKDSVVEGLRFDASVAVNSPTASTYTSAQVTNPFSGLISGYWSWFVTPNSVIVDHGLTGKSFSTDRYFPIARSKIDLLNELYISNGLGGQAIQTNLKDLTIAPMFTAYAGVGLFAELPSVISDPITAAAKTVSPSVSPNYINLEGFVAGHVSNERSLDRAFNSTNVTTAFSTYGIKGSIAISGAFALNVSYGAGIGAARHYVNQTTTFSLSFSR